MRSTFDVGTDFADLVISLEVIEHLKDQPETEFSDVVLFNESGIRSYASEVQRIGKAGADIILTTPNPCSYKAIANAVGHSPAYVFRQHVREYSKTELLRIFDRLTPVHYQSLFNFFMMKEVGLRADWKKISRKWAGAPRTEGMIIFFTLKTLNHCLYRAPFCTIAPQVSGPQ